MDTALQVVEFLRDASHVRDYRVSEWQAMQGAAGFDQPAVRAWKLPMEFQGWIARIGTPPARVAALEAVFAELSGRGPGVLSGGSRQLLRHGRGVVGDAAANRVS